MNIIYRKATADDISEINQIMIKGINDSCLFSDGDLHQVDKWELNIQYLNKIVGNDSHFLYVAEDNSRLLGVIYAYIQPIPEVPYFTRDLIMYVESLDVLKEHRNKGIGTNLLKKIEEVGKTKEILVIDIEVYKRNEDARLLYEKNGYYTIKERMRKKISVLD